MREIDFDVIIKYLEGEISRMSSARLCKKPTTPQRKTYTSSAVKEAADRLENLRLKLKARRADSSQQKMTFVTQDSDLLYAVDILENIAAAKAESEA